MGLAEGLASLGISSGTSTGAQTNVANTFTQPQTLPVIDKGGQVFNVGAYGLIDPTGTVDSTAAFVAAVTAMPTVTVSNATTNATYPVGTLYIPPGKFKIGSVSDIGNLGPYVSILGPGKGSCKVYYYGSGVAFQAQWLLAETNNTYPADTFPAMFANAAPQDFAGVFNGFTLDGSNAGAGAVGMRTCGPEGGVMGPDLTIRHFNGAGSIGWDWNNPNGGTWNENLTGNINVYDCTTCVQASGGGSHGYNDLRIKVYLYPNQSGFALTGGTAYYGGSLRVRANCCKGPSNTGAVLSLSGGSSFQQCNLDVTTESNVSIGGSVEHQSIHFAVPGTDYIQACYGILSLNDTALSNWIRTGSQVFGFTGEIRGDTGLNPGFGINVGSVNGVHHPTSSIPLVSMPGEVTFTATFTSTATGGAFTMTCNGVASGSIPWNATAAQFLAAVLSTVNAVNCAVSASGGPLGTNPITVLFTQSDSVYFESWYVSNNTLSGGSLAFAPTGVSLDLSSGNAFDLGQLGGASTFPLTFANWAGGSERHIWIRTQQSGWNAQLTWPGGYTFVWAENQAPYLTSQNNAVDWFELWCAVGSSNNTFYGIHHASTSSPITSGALPTVSLSSGTGAQVSTARDVYLSASITYTPTAGASATCVVAISPDNTTYSTLVTETVPLGTALDSFVKATTIVVPAGWYVKLTTTNATIGTCTYY